MFSKSLKYQKKALGFPEAKLAWFNIADQLKSATAVSIPRGVKYSEELPFLVSSPPKVESKIKKDFFIIIRHCLAFIQGQPLGIDIMYLVLVNRNMQVRFGLKGIWEF